MNKWLLDRILHVREFLFVYDCAFVRKICSMKHLSVKLVKWSQRPFFTSTSNRMICSTSKIRPSKFQNTKKMTETIEKDERKKKLNEIYQHSTEQTGKICKTQLIIVHAAADLFLFTQLNVEIYFMARARVCVCMRVSFFVFCSSIELILFIQFICCVSHVISMRRQRITKLTSNRTASG